MADVTDDEPVWALLRVEDPADLHEAAHIVAQKLTGAPITVSVVAQVVAGVVEDMIRIDGPRSEVERAIDEWGMALEECALTVAGEA